MMSIVIILLVGMILGFFLKKIPRFNPFAEKLTTYLIYILLFFMGLHVGGNPDIMNNIEVLGLNAVVIAIFSVLGSIILARAFKKIITPREK